MTNSQIEKYFKDLKYVEVVQERHSYLFSPEVWQQKQIDQTLSAFKELKEKLGSDGLISAGSSPALSDFIGPIFHSMNTDVSSDTKLQLGVNKDLSLSFNGRIISIPASGKQPPLLADQLKSHHLIARSPDAVGSKAEPTTEVTPLTVFSLMDCGRNAGVQSERAADLSNAALIISSHFLAFESAKASLKSALANALLGHDLKDLNNSPLDELSDAEKNGLQVAFDSRWKQLGFDSPTDAANFLSHCTVSTNSSFSLTGSSGGSTYNSFQFQ